jgi:hypothetical protein
MLGCLQAVLYVIILQERLSLSWRSLSYFRVSSCDQNILQQAVLSTDPDDSSFRKVHMHLDRFARPAGIQVIPLLNLLFQDTSHTGKLIDDLFIVDD